MPVPLPSHLDPVQQATILGPGTRSRTASNIQVESSKLHQRYDLEAPKMDKEIFDKVRVREDNVLKVSAVQVPASLP